MIKVFSVMFCLLFLLTACGKQSGKSGKNPKQVIRVSAGTNVPSLGMAIDAYYDRNTDGLIQGYKILSVALTNNSIDVMQTDKLSDQWFVTDMHGARHKAIIDLRNADPRAFAGLSERIRSLIEYPLIIQVGETRIIDLMFRSNVTLDSFQNVRFILASTGKNIEIIP